MTLDLFLVCVLVGGLAGVLVEVLSAPSEMPVERWSEVPEESLRPVRRPVPRRRARA